MSKPTQANLDVYLDRAVAQAIAYIKSQAKVGNDIGLHLMSKALVHDIERYIEGTVELSKEDK